jgi:hypothetical protein
MTGNIPTNPVAVHHLLSAESQTSWKPQHDDSVHMQIKSITRTTFEDATSRQAVLAAAAAVGLAARPGSTPVQLASSLSSQANSALPELSDSPRLDAQLHLWKSGH